MQTILEELEMLKFVSTFCPIDAIFCYQESILYY
jgi:hypothetical protein